MPPPVFSGPDGCELAAYIVRTRGYMSRRPPGGQGRDRETAHGYNATACVYARCVGMWRVCSVRARAERRAHARREHARRDRRERRARRASTSASGASCMSMCAAGAAPSLRPAPSARRELAPPARAARRATGCATSPPPRPSACRFCAASRELRRWRQPRWSARARPAARARTILRRRSSAEKEAAPVHCRVPARRPSRARWSAPSVERLDSTTAIAHAEEAALARRLRVGARASPIARRLRACVHVGGSAAASPSARAVPPAAPPPSPSAYSKRGGFSGCLDQRGRHAESACHSERGGSMGDPHMRVHVEGPWFIS